MAKIIVLLGGTHSFCIKHTIGVEGPFDIIYSNFLFLHMRKLRQGTELRKEFKFLGSWATALLDI